MAKYGRMAGMKKSTLTLMLLSAATVGMLSSCAYMQTHKNIDEMGHTYRASELKSDNLALHRKGGQWYLSAPAGDYKKSYPIVHDDIFSRNNNDPTYSLKRATESRDYHPISAGTAASLQRNDGYAQTNGLVAEIVSQGKPTLTELPGAATYPIRAEIVNGKQPAVIVTSRTPEKTPTSLKVLSGIDMCTVDAVGSVVYNVAIPFMAPFRFFWEFCTED